MSGQKELISHLIYHQSDWTKVTDEISNNEDSVFYPRCALLDILYSDAHARVYKIDLSIKSCAQSDMGLPRLGRDG